MAAIEIREALTFDDVLLVPAYSEVLPAQVSVQSRLTRDIMVHIPLVAAAMNMSSGLPTPSLVASASRLECRARAFLITRSTFARPAAIVSACCLTLNHWRIFDFARCVLAKPMRSLAPIDHYSRVALSPALRGT